MASTPSPDSFFEDWHFVSWLLVMGFLIETPYPEFGDPIFVFEDGIFIYKGVLAKDGVRNLVSPRFFYSVTEQELKRFHERYRDSAA